jgi:hypothetical protein
MRYTVTRQVIQVIGAIWQHGFTCAQERNLSDYEMASIENPRDRYSVASWIDTHFGDFQHIQDFRADFHLGNENVVHEWKSEESECTFNDRMYPAED